MKYFLLAIGFIFSATSSMAQDSIQYAYCWGKTSNGKICKQAEILDDDFRINCRAFADDVEATSYGYRYSESLEYLEQSMGQNCDEVQDGGSGEIYACMLASYCEGDTSRSIKNLASRVYANSEEKGIDRCLNINSSRIMREIKKQSALGCFVKIELEIFEFDGNSSSR